MHPYIIGELAMGSMKNRKRILQDLNDLVTVLPVRHADVMTMIENRELYGTGLQYIDAHLLAATLITDGCKLWTRDKRLHDAAEKLGVAA